MPSQITTGISLAPEISQIRHASAPTASALETLTAQVNSILSLLSTLSPKYFGQEPAMEIDGGNLTPLSVRHTQLSDNAVGSNNIQPGSVGAVAIGDRTITGTKMVLDTLTAAEIAAGTITANEIAANTITAGQIAANTITAGQIQAGTITTTEIAANTITAGDIAANTITAGQIAANTITAAQIQAGSITTTEIAANTITAGDIAANTITAGQIAANTITASQIAAGTITTTQIAANTILAGNIAAGTITGDRLVANTITATQIAAATITATEIASNAISAAKILAGAVTVTKLNIAKIIVVGTLESNQPSAGKMRWSGVVIYYDGVAYSITDNNTASVFAYWTVGNTTLTTADSFTLNTTRFLIYANQSGTADTAWDKPANYGLQESQLSFSVNTPYQPQQNNATATIDMGTTGTTTILSESANGLLLNIGILVTDTPTGSPVLNLKIQVDTFSEQTVAKIYDTVPGSKFDENLQINGMQSLGDGDTINDFLTLPFWIPYRTSISVKVEVATAATTTGEIFVSVWRSLRT